MNYLLDHRGRSKHSLERMVSRSLEEYGAQGYCTSVDEWRQGVTGVAVPLFLSNLGRRIVLTCGGVASQMSADAIHERIAPLLMGTAKKIEGASSRLKHL